MMGRGCCVVLGVPDDTMDHLFDQETANDAQK